MEKYVLEVTHLDGVRHVTIICHVDEIERKVDIKMTYEFLEDFSNFLTTCGIKTKIIQSN